MLNIKKCVQRHGLTNQEVAQRMGISAVSFSQQINGNPKVSFLSKLAAVLHCDITELFEQPTRQCISIDCPHCKERLEVHVEVTKALE